MQTAIKKARVIRPEVQLIKISSATLLVLTESAGAKLPSRGMTLVEGTIGASRLSHLRAEDDFLPRSARSRTNGTVSEHRREKSFSAPRAPAKPSLAWQPVRCVSRLEFRWSRMAGEVIG
jgi:hypothetical protein